jgi:hypothetical protein
MKEVNCQIEEWRKWEQEDKKRKEAWDKEQAARKKEAESRLATPRGREIRLRRPNTTWKHQVLQHADQKYHRGFRRI